MKNNVLSIEWFKASLIRALRTAAQSAVATIGVTKVMSEVDWRMVVSTALLSAILSVLMALAGLPEVENEYAIPEGDDPNEN